MSDKIGLESRFDISSSKILKKNNRVKPKFFKLLGIIMNSHMDVIYFLNKPIFNYLDLVDLAKIRGANKLLLALAHDYFPKRLRIEVEFIKSFQESCYDSFLNFMKIIDSQIPLSNKNWLDFDLTSVINKLKVLDKKVITALKAIKNTGKLPETVFAPICIILGYNV